VQRACIAAALLLRLSRIAGLAAAADRMCGLRTRICLQTRIHRIRSLTNDDDDDDESKSCVRSIHDVYGSLAVTAYRNSHEHAGDAL